MRAVPSSRFVTWIDAQAGIGCSDTGLHGVPMLRYYFINREWIMSSTARCIYRTAAVLSMGLFVGLCLLPLSGGIVLDSPAVNFLLFIGVVGAAITVVAMEYFLFGFDRSPEWKKVCWFCIMVLPLIGPALYGFIVYSRADMVKRNTTDPIQTHP